ncbi:MAG: hypothetical protein ACRDBO_00005, partial [Lachnospiraceae bacterium]
TTVKKELDGYLLELDELNKQMEGSMSPEEREDIETKAAEFVLKKKRLEELYALAPEFTRLTEFRDKKAFELSSKQAAYDEKERILNSEQEALERKAALLADSGCIDLDNARCHFLADAVEAKSLLLDYPSKFFALGKERDKALDALEKELADAEKERENLGYAPETIAELQQECNQLQCFDKQLKSLQEAESRIALIKASAANTQLNISKVEERLATLKMRAESIEKERLKYQDNHNEHEQLLREIESLKPWLEKEKQLPVARERRENAEQRFVELGNEIISSDNEIWKNQDLAQVEKAASEGIEELETQVQQLQYDADQITRESRANQIKIGGLKQKVEEVNRMKKAIAAIQLEITEMSEDAADYDLLKLSFGQDGIPHQIIRTVIPKLSATANNILGQMTGGQLGVDFVTEKVQTNKKEVVTLDIFIEEYGRSSLPYLSKSGGEKVKASLSVVLALAEMKASTAGIQFGMLFIDEPPFLDADGIQAYCDALEIIRERYPNMKVMAITHDPTMKSRFPQSLDVVKTENGSKVIY